MFGYQKRFADDGDPNDEALFLGETIKKTPISANGYSVLYLESIRDLKFADESAIVFTSQASHKNKSLTVFLRFPKEYRQCSQNVF